MVTQKASSDSVGSASSSTPSQRRSEDYIVKAMPAILGTFDMTAIYVAIVFLVANATAAASSGAVSLIYWLIAGVAFFLPGIIAVAQMGSMYPAEGGLYHWTNRAFGGFWSFFAIFCTWFPCIPLILGSTSTTIAFIETLHPGWLALPWQQGLTMIGIILFSGILALQRFRMVQNIVNVAICLLFVAIALLGISAMVWLLQGHIAASSFKSLQDWQPTQTNFPYFGLILFALLGVIMPMSMGGEITERRSITNHLRWGSLVIFLGYLIVTFSSLVLAGPDAIQNPTKFFITSIDKGLGTIANEIATVCILCFSLMVPVVCNYTFARLLLISGVDQILPKRIGLLNKNRVPANAIIYQTLGSMAFAIITFFIVPPLLNFGTADLARIMFNICQAIACLVWGVAMLFLFLDLIYFLTRGQEQLRNHRIIPRVVLWLSAIFGIAFSLIGMVHTLFYSWIPDLLNTTQWLATVAGFTVASLTIAGIISSVAGSEAAWQKLAE